MESINYSLWHSTKDDDFFLTMLEHERDLYFVYLHDEKVQEADEETMQLIEFDSMIAESGNEYPLEVNFVSVFKRSIGTFCFVSKNVEDYELDPLHNPLSAVNAYTHRVCPESRHCHKIEFQDHSLNFYGDNTNVNITSRDIPSKCIRLVYHYLMDVHSCNNVEYKRVGTYHIFMSYTYKTKFYIVDMYLDYTPIRWFELSIDHNEDADDYGWKPRLIDISNPDDLNPIFVIHKSQHILYVYTQSPYIIQVSGRLHDVKCTNDSIIVISCDRISHEDFRVQMYIVNYYHDYDKYCKFDTNVTKTYCYKYSQKERCYSSQKNRYHEPRHLENLRFGRMPNITYSPQQDILILGNNVLYLYNKGTDVLVPLIDDLCSTNVIINCMVCRRHRYIFIHTYACTYIYVDSILLNIISNLYFVSMNNRLLNIAVETGIQDLKYVLPGVLAELVADFVV